MGVTMKDTEREIERTRRYLERLVRVSSSQSEHYPASSSLGGFTAGESEVRWRKSTSVTIMDEKIIPAAFKKQKIAEVVDKAGIKDALKKGKFVDGATLTEKQNIQIK